MYYIAKNQKYQFVLFCVILYIRVVTTEWRFMMNTIQERLTKLRALMKDKQIDAYIVPSADNHQSEYVGEYFKARAFITGFTGSAGTAVITQTEAGLWTDGRYFIQAEAELAGTGITLYKMGNPDVPTINEYLEATLPEHATLGFDGRLIAMESGMEYAKELEYKNIKIVYAYDLIDEIWTDRPELPKESVFALDIKYAGESRVSKLSRLREAMQKAKTSCHILITLDDIAWLLNLRGRDVLCSPLFLSYAVITLEEVHLFIEEEKLSPSIKEELARDQVILHPYNNIYNYVRELDACETVLIDPSTLNYALYNNIPASVKKVEQPNPTTLMKAVKNEVEIENIKNAHIKDGIAHTKFMYWLKTTLGKESITELSASDKLEAFRKEQDGFLWPSFEPISAFGGHAAMCHYSSSKETNCELKPGYLFLTDTGGNYYEGSTDITRTFAIGEISEELKYDFTSVLKSMLRLSRVNFLYGCCGLNLDIIARQPLWDIQKNYNHGTGHGVGYLLNIHEGPCGFRWKATDATSITPLEHGMIITNEPGLYIEGSHGIRIENEMLIRKGIQNEYGQFMYLEPVTFVPIDLDAVNPTLLDAQEKTYLNDYHQKVYNLISPYLTDEEREWLKIYTRSI